MARVKICGVTRLEDAELAVELGAWALGFIFHADSPRSVEPAVAAGIARAMHRRAQLVGVFVDPTLDHVAAIADTVKLTHLQLHGSVGPSFCLEAGRRTGCRVIRAFRVGERADIRDAERFHTDFHLLDSRVRDLHGGSGETWDWALLAQRGTDVPLILAGGLTADNVAQSIREVRPYAVDVASGVEASPGVKDPEKLRAFIGAAAATLSVPGPREAADPLLEGLEAGAPRPRAGG